MEEANRSTPAPMEHHAGTSDRLAQARKEGLQDLGMYIASRTHLARGMGDSVDLVRQLFFQQSEARGISGASYTSGFLAVGEQTRDYLFAERYLGKGAKATVGVRIANIGTDLYVEWRYYILPPKKFNPAMFAGGVVLTSPLCCCGYAFVMQGDDLTPRVAGALIFTAIAVAVWVAAYRFAGNARAEWLEGFQDQDAVTFRLAVEASIEEALDGAGIAKEMRITTEHVAPQSQQRRRWI